MASIISDTTEGQGEQFKRFVEDAAERAFKQAGLDKDQLQRLFGCGGEFQGDIRALIMRLSRSNQYANEVVASSYTYPLEYAGPKPIGQQIDILARAFGLSLGGTQEFIDKVLPGLMLPEGAEGWFAIPSVVAVAKCHFPKIKNPAERYCRAVELIIEKLKATRIVHNYREGELGTKYLRQHPRTVQAFDRIMQQKGDILIVAAQFGMGHRGESVRRAHELFTPNEYGLGALAVGSMALTHPERFVRWEQLHTHCAGDQYDFGARGAWGLAPIVSFCGGELEFYARRVVSPDENCGSVSGFLPER
ncbi:hypothetical protein EXS71_01120 [Candidatus Uhrbacteria bacterium]|nr:hypothetical protein [Candidatus Uhrbacteria bacterium]